jgi:hypothetical protein
MDYVEKSMQSSGETEAERRQDGGGERDPLPQSEKARGNETPKEKGVAPGAGDEVWTREHGTRHEGGEFDPGASNRGKRAAILPTGEVIGSGAGAGGGAPEDFDSDPQAGSGQVDMPRDGSRPSKGGDAPSHGSR